MNDAGNGMYTVWAIFVVQWAIFMLLGWYLEQVGIGLVEWFCWSHRVMQGRTAPLAAWPRAVIAGTGCRLCAWAAKHRAVYGEAFSWTPDSSKGSMKT
jgi:hypothetical protein